MASEQPEVVAAVGATLGEGPVWIGADHALWFTDIKGPHLFRFDPDTREVRRWTAPTAIGWLLPAADGGFLAGLADGLHRFSPETGFSHHAVIEPHLPGNRLNDAVSDPAGRLWFGSMDNGEVGATGHFYRGDAGGIARVGGGIAITNGPAVSPDGRTLYQVDTVAGLVHASRIADDGTLADTRLFTRIAAVDGHPDGPTVDAEGHVWIGLFGGWAVRRYRPDGVLDREVRFPVANITKVALGGPDGRTAYATTARLALSPAALAAQPLAGHLFAFDAGVAGVPVAPVAAIGPLRPD